MADAVGPFRRKFLANLLPIAKQQLGMVFGLLLLLLVATFVSERFLTFPNLLNVLRQVAIVGILAIGQTFVILTAGIDLSVGSSLGLTVVFLAGLLQHHGLLTSIPLGISAGAAMGLINGLGVAYARIPAFIMTLGMLSFGRGIAFIYTGGTPIPIIDNTCYYIGNGYITGIPIPSLILLGTVLLSIFVLNLTPFGRCIYAIGSNEDAARLSGVPTRRYKLLVYLICGLCAGIAGLVYSSQLSVGTPIAGEGYELDAIAAVVVGGTSLFGGAGSVIRTFVGTLFIGVLANILNLAGVDPFVQQLAKGALIVIAVFIMNQIERR
ncbi:MAG TPA: ABC transporter permease [Chthoniobacterales bacterium]|nr:ABC transporter permease [Chthoniobacterales bacterium]